MHNNKTTMKRPPKKAVFPATNQKCSGSFSLRTGANSFCTGANVFRTGANVFCTGAQVFCTGAQAFCTGANVFCTGANVFCTGARVFCTGAQTKRTGAFLPFFGFRPQSLVPKSVPQGAQHISFTTLLTFKTQNYG
jgi:hypothetical protein